MSELRTKGPIGVSQEEEEELSGKRKQPVQRPQPYPHGFPVQWGKQTYLQGEGSAEKMSDLVWAKTETRGMCRREDKSIPGKENSPHKGLDAGG